MKRRDEAETESAEQFVLAHESTEIATVVAALEARDAAVAFRVLVEIEARAKVMNQERNSDWSDCLRAAFEEISEKYTPREPKK